ncbi:hypothetical protein BDW66DRAFT_154414 [Aspergillus desertorum]
MNRDVAIAMYLAIFGSLVILAAMCLTNGFSRMAENFSFCFSRSRTRNRERAQRGSNEQHELEGETELKTLRPCPGAQAERSLAGTQSPSPREEHASAFFYRWYLPYNGRLSQTEPQSEPEPEPESEGLPRYEHPPAYTHARPSVDVCRGERNSHCESLDVTERRQAPGPRNESGNVAVDGHREEPENGGRFPDVTQHRER